MILQLKDIQNQELILNKCEQSNSSFLIEGEFQWRR